MADDSEIIGAIGVSITGDYSSLQAAFTSAQGAAQQAGEDIADALAAGGAAGADLGEQIAQGLAPIAGASESANQSLTGLADAIDAANAPATELSASLGDLGDSAGGATDAVDGLGNALPDAADGAKEVDESSKEASNSLAEMAEKMAAVGEALVITEGLLELGTEALGAADSITTASIALTTMTGSADTAHETIEQLEQLGMQDGLAMPSLLTAAQRMTAMLPPGTDVANLLGSIADGAAVMGSGIDQAANRFDQMTNSGTLAARSLMSLGLSLTTVATAMNTVDPSADATATTVAAMFKAMDPGDRITVLQTALASLGGTAQQVANQTFGGQWQQLADAWEGIMVQVGQAILPVISDLISLTKTDILPFVKEMVTDFNALPTPVKDVAVGMALMSAAVIPVTGGLAALGLAVSGLQGLLPAVTGLMAAFGGTAATVATEETAQTVATAEMGAAAAAAVPEVETLAAAETQLSLSFAENLGEVGLVGEQLSLELLPAVEATGAGLAAFTTGVGAMGLGLMAIGPIAGIAVLSAASLKDGWSQAKDTFANVKGTIEQIPGVMQSVSSGSGILATIAGDLKSAWSGVLSVFEQYNTYSLAAQAINKITDAVDVFLGITPGAAAMTAAMSSELAKLQTSGEAAAKAIGTVKDSLTPLQTAIHDIVTAQDQAESAYQISLQTYNALNSSLQNGTAIYNGQVATIKEVSDAYSAMEKAAAAAGVTLAPLPGSMEAIDAAATKLATSTGFVVSAQQEQANKTAVAKSSLDLANVSYDTSIAKVDLLKAQLDDANAAYTAGLAPRSAVIDAEQNLQKAYADSQKESQALNTANANYASTMAALSGAPLTGLQSALAEATAKVQDLGAKMQDGANVGQQYDKALTAQLNAQIALDEESATLGTGLQGATDAISLATIAVADAKAKYNDLVTAWQAGQPVLTQLEAAQKALTTAQSNLNTTVGQAGPLIQTYDWAMDAVNTTVGQAGPLIQTYDGAMVAVGNNAVTAGNQIQTGMLTALQNLAGQLPPTVTDMLGLHDAIANLQSQMPNFGIVTTALSGGPLTGLQSALAEATAKVQDLGAKMQDGANVGQQYEKALTAQLNAQIALDQESATLGTGLQGATDAISLATIAVADAKVKYNDLVTAWQAGQPVLTQLEAAQKALKTAQDNLNTAVGQASPLIHTQTSEQQSLTPAVTGATTAISNQTTALKADAAALQSVASAVQQVESDFSSAMGSVPSAATAGAPAGYEWQVTTIAGHQTATLVPLPETSYKLAEQAAEAVTATSGTTPQDLAADVLAEAQAVLKVDQEYYGEKSSTGAQIVTAQALQSAQQAVATAQAALTAFTSSTSSSTSSSSSTGTTNNSQSSTTSSASTESAGSSAIDGGSYTPVTAHQASGEVWAVSTSGASVSGSVATTSVSQTVTNTTVSDASTGALVATASAVGSAVQEIATFSGGLLPITTNLANVASSITTLVSAVGGVLQRLSTGSTVTSAAPASVYGNTGERSYTTGTESTYYPGGNPMGSTVSTPNTGAPAVPGGNAGSGPTSINAPVNVTVNTSNPVDANQLATQIANTLVSTLRTAGARF